MVLVGLDDRKINSCDEAKCHASKPERMPQDVRERLVSPVRRKLVLPARNVLPFVGNNPSNEAQPNNVSGERKAKYWHIAQKGRTASPSIGLPPSVEVPGTT